MLEIPKGEVMMADFGLPSADRWTGEGDIELRPNGLLRHTGPCEAGADIVLRRDHCMQLMFELPIVFMQWRRYRLDAQPTN